MSSQPIIEKLIEDPGQSFLFRRIKRKERSDLHEDGVWHFHPDFEITFTLKSSGRRFVGFTNSNYAEYDFVLLGNKLPHCWITAQSTDQIVINFKKEVFGSLFWNTPEMQRINELLDKSQQGVAFSIETAKEALPILYKMEHETGFDKLLHLFELLNLMANSTNQKALTFYHHEIKDSIKASNRIEKIYNYIHLNYQSNQISFEQLSKNLNMTKSSVCKFIKKVTKKSFTELVIEARINEACKMLSETDMFISEICFKCGFNNLSNFNRAFKKVMLVTPKQYRQI